MRRYGLKRRRLSSGTKVPNQRRDDPMRTNFLQVLCDWKSRLTCSQPDSGIHIYMDYVEHCMLELYTTVEGLFNVLLGHAGTDKVKLSHCLDVSTTLATLFESLESQTSIDDIAWKLFAHYRTSHDVATQHLDRAQRTVVACSGWISMMFSPLTNPSCMEFCYSAGSSHSGTHYNISSAVKRPFGAVLRGLDLIPIPCRPRTAEIPEKATLLAISHLNVFVLSKLGALSVTWVDDLTSHCKLDLSRKELMLFRFPSYCSHVYCSTSPSTMIDRFARAHTCRHGCATTTDANAKAYLMDVLLSYRILFGQDGRSRKLYREVIAPQARSEGLYDPLLDVLCSSKVIPKTTLIYGMLEERSVYSSTADITYLGPRLAQLQEYSLNQKPRTLVEVWNDHRDPHQSLTFWAVVIVGGCSVLLSLIQVLLGIAQLIVQARSTPG